MAEGEAPSSGLTIDDVHGILSNAGPQERECLHELLEKGNAREAMVFAQALHYFPNSRLVEVNTPEIEDLVVDELFLEI